MRNKQELKSLQSLPLQHKIALTQARVEEWVEHFGEDGVYVSFSGGKDSTVLLHIVRDMYPGVEAVYVDTGLEYPEIKKFVKTFDNVTILRPKMRFDEVIKKYGYPVISKEVSQAIHEARRSIELGNENTVRLKRLRGELKTGNDGKDRSQFNCEKYEPLLRVDFRISHHCCKVMKKAPSKEYAKKSNKYPLIAQMASESILRTQKWIQNGCNGFDMKSPVSNPMAFWMEQDVLQYIKDNNISIASVYGDIVYADNPEQVGFGEMISGEANFWIEGQRPLLTTGCKRTGCIFCAFGAHCNNDARFIELKRTHPRQYEYCIGGGEYNKEGVWEPNKEGLGMGHVFDELNKLYGKRFIEY